MQNPVLFGNWLILEADRHAHAMKPNPVPGPCAASRAMAIAHIAMADVCARYGANYAPYIPGDNFNGGDKDAAIVTASHTILKNLYQNDQFLLKEYDAYIESIRFSGVADDEIDAGVINGQTVAQAILSKRQGDDVTKLLFDVPFAGSREPQFHNVDPFHPGQGFYGAGWKDLEPFVLTKDEVDTDKFSVPRFTDLDFGTEVVPAFEEVGKLGGVGNSERSLDEEHIGIFWSYDGSAGLGTPPRLYNQFVVQTALHDRRTDNIDALARLLALVNLAMADAGIVCWKAKYDNRVARPVRWLNRDHINIDGTFETGEHIWEPLGAQASLSEDSKKSANKNLVFFAVPEKSHRADFSPPFPAYPSGHATFGSAALNVLRDWRGKDELGIWFTSDELNGRTQDSKGYIRPNKPRPFDTISLAIEENNRSRIFLGVHWKFDQDEGSKSGEAIAKRISEGAYRITMP